MYEAQTQSHQFLKPFSIEEKRASLLQLFRTIKNIPDLSQLQGEWGLAIWGGESPVYAIPDNRQNYVYVSKIFLIKLLQSVFIYKQRFTLTSRVLFCLQIFWIIELFDGHYSYCLTIGRWKNKNLRFPDILN